MTRIAAARRSTDVSFAAGGRTIIDRITCEIEAGRAR